MSGKTKLKPSPLIPHPSLRPRWKMVKFGDVVKNSNLVERNPVVAGIERIVGLEHIETENLHIRRWNSPEGETSFARKFVPGQTLFGKRRAYQRKAAFAEFEGICSGDILTFESKNPKLLLPELLPFICQTDAFFNYALGTSAGSLSPRTSWSVLQAYKVNPMGTVVEGEWNEIMELIKKCHATVMKTGERAVTKITIDDRKGKPDRIEEKVKSIERRIGKPLKK